MADETKDENDLLGLFSVRSSKERPIDRQALLPGSPTSSVKVTSRDSAPVTTQSVRSGSSSGAIQRSAATGAYSRARLSPLANTIMREARRELGNDVGMNAEGQEVSEDKIAGCVDKVLRKRNETIDDIERANIIIHLQKDLLGWGVLQPLFDNKEITDIHVYDHQTVVLQRGKKSETTGIHWPNQAAYVSFVDRVLLRLGKSLSTQQHTIDGSFPDGTRVCAIHESVCGCRGPYLSIRVPRLTEVTLENIIAYQVAPEPIVNYLAALVRSCQITMMVAGETGTGKTTLIKCLGTQFGSDESIVSVEDTPELNFQHPYFRSLVSRTANTEGVGEVTLQEHIKTTLRMTPTRVLLGEMRTPFAAEAFLEAAQTGHTGMSTVHARNARETLVRLESLLGRAQKSVSIDIIRQQIALAVDVVIWLFREKGNGKPRIGEIIEVGHFVEGQIQIRPMFKLIKTGDKPVWRTESWSSNHDDILEENNVYLSDLPPEITFNQQPGDGGRR